jgi:hypothetical protein
MKKWAVLIVALYPAAAAFANPISFDPIGTGSFVIVVGSALLVEACLTALLLFFCHMDLTRSFFALLGGNVAIYLFLFLPLLSEVHSVLAAEAVIVAADGAYIKILSTFEPFQMEEFKGLKWRTAFICAAVGNAMSYFVGAAMSGHHAVS